MMSAWLVSKEHIQYMIESATRFHNPHGMTDEEARQDMADTANMLWEANLKSIQTRHSVATDTIQKFTQEDFLQFTVFTSMKLPEFAQLAKSINCYQYQSCEYDEFEQSKANKFCEDLKDSICRALPGYEDAEWGGPNGE